MDETPFWRQGKWLRAAAIVAAIAIIVAIAIAARITNGSSSHSAATTTTVSGDRQTTDSSPSAASGRPAGCATDDADQAAPTGPLTDVSWELVDGVALPRSRSAGPMLVRGDIRSCFAHTPTGAVMAAINIDVARGLPSRWQATTASQVAAGPGKTAWQARAATAIKQVSQPNQIGGFQVVDYSRDAAVVGILVTRSDGSTVSADLHVIWSNGDWIEELNPDGSGLTNPVFSPDTSEFVPLKGVG